MESKGSEFHLVTTPHKKSSTDEKPPRRKIDESNSTLEVISGSAQLAMVATTGRRIETLTTHLEMPIFEGWNLDGWIFRVERFFTAHQMSKDEKILATTTISLYGEALAWF